MQFHTPTTSLRRNEFGFYYDDCQCLECQYVRGHISIAPQENANRSPDESKNDAPYSFWLGAEAA